MKKWLVAGLAVAALVWELIAAYDHDPQTWPLTWIIRAYVPWWIYFPAAIILGVWLVYHFRPVKRRERRRHRENGMRE